MTMLFGPEGMMVHLSGLPNHVPLDEETAEALVAEYPDMRWCCMNAANEETALESLTSCVCWEPVYDKEQQTPVEKAAVMTRHDQCVDCAYRHDSPEFTDRWVLDRALEKGVFWCHQGMRRPTTWRHPAGAEVPGDPADYAPPIIDGVPYQADGLPAQRCKGWDERRVRQPVTWSDVRKGVHRLSEEREEWEGIPIPLPNLKLRLREGHTMREAALKFDQTLNGVEIEIHCGGGDVRDDEFIRNQWYSRRLQKRVIIYQQGDKVFHCAVFEATDLCMTRLDLGINTMLATDAWELDAEYRARDKLRGMLTTRQWEAYELTGAFIEESERSHLFYVFRRLKPTIVLSPRSRSGGMKCICVLCLHPIGFYDNSWAGCMVPTDDVIAHLLMCRGDEAGFWGKANHHAPWHAEAGL